LGSMHLKRECGAYLNAQELTREKKVDMGENISPKHCPKSKDFNKLNTRVYISGRTKSGMFKKFGKHWLQFPNLKRECGASLNARKLTREKKVHSGENLSPKHYPNR